MSNLRIKGQIRETLELMKLLNDWLTEHKQTHYVNAGARRLYEAMLQEALSNLASLRAVDDVDENLTEFPF